MNQTFYPILFIVCIILLFQSCEYSPPEIPLTEVEKPSDQGSIISINLTPNKDTIKLSTSVNVTYTLDVGSHEIYDLKFFMDDVDMGNLFNGVKGSFSTTISASKFADGLHELKIRTNTSTNTGSIADKVQAEQYLYEIRWPVIIDKGAKDRVKFSNLLPIQNGVKLSWLKYDFADFQKCTVGKSSIIPYQSKELVNTTDPNLNTVIDDNYIEGDYVTYSLKVYMDGLAMDSRSYVEEIKKPKLTINFDRTVDVSWSPSKNPQNLKSYFLKTIVPTFGYPEEYEVSDLNQTAIRFNEKPGFGGSYGMQLRYIPKGYVGYNTFDVAGGLASFALGDSIPAFQRGFLIEGANSLLIYKDGNFFRYNYSTHQSSSPFSITPIESVYQRFIVSSASCELFGYFESKQFVVRKSSDWSLVGKMDIEAYEGINSILSTVSISNNGMVATVDIYNILRIFNLQTGTKILEKESDSSLLVQRAVLSPDGENVCLLYRSYLENKSLLTSNTVDNGKLKENSRYERFGYDYESSFTYSAVNGKIIFYNYLGAYSYKIEILNPETLVLENSLKMPEFFFPIAYDYSDDQVIGQYQFFPIKKFSYLLDVKTGKQSKVVQFVGQEQYLFSNGTVFAGNGRSIKIDDFIIE